MMLGNEETKNLCMALISADSEAEAIAALTDINLWDDEKLWRYFDDKEVNFSNIGNQVNRPEKALVEKLVNSVDARLMGECLAQGINPEGPNSPPSIRKAVAQFFDKNANPDSATAGLISMWPAARRTKIARGITLAATGFMPSKGYPCFSIADSGEGQTPEMFPSTFLSLTESNKMRIPFVQGRFNMGGTGVLRFCGKSNLQLIVSRRNPKILDGDFSHESDGMWGFTIVRRENPHGNRRNSVYTYLAPVFASSDSTKGGVLRFTASSLPIFPDKNNPYARQSEWGTLIKLYEYQLTGSKSNIIRRGGVLSKLDLLLPNLALPIRLHECRSGYGGQSGSYDTNLTGVAVRLDDNRAENLEFDPTSSPIRVMGEQMIATIYVFKKGKAKTYKGSEGIIFTVNGQAHAHFTRDFFHRNRVGMDYLADSILVNVDCSNIGGRAREDLFMNSRDRLGGGDLRKEIEKALEDLIGSHEGLRELKESRRRKEIEARVADDKPLEDILQELLRSSPALANFLLKGMQLSAPFKSPTVIKRQEKYLGKKFPTFFKLRDIEYGKILVKDCHINRRPRIQFETDVVNDFFSREVDKGEFGLYFSSNGTNHLVEDYLLRLHEGKAYLSLQLPHNCQVNDELAFVAKVTDETNLKEFANSFRLVIRPETTNQGGGRKKKTRRSKAGTDMEGGLALPNIIRIPQDAWEEQEPTPFDEYTALRIKHAGLFGENGNEKSVFDFYINVDNIFLKTALKDARKDPKTTEAKFIYGMTLLGLAMIKHDTDVKSSTSQVSARDDKDDWRIDEKVETLTSAAAIVILLMIDELSELDIEEASLLVGDGEAT